MSLNLPKRWWVASRPFDQWGGIPFWQCPKRQGPASPATPRRHLMESAQTRTPYFPACLLHHKSSSELSAVGRRVLPSHLLSTPSQGFPFSFSVVLLSFVFLFLLVPPIFSSLNIRLRGWPSHVLDFHSSSSSPRNPSPLRAIVILFHDARFRKRPLALWSRPGR